MSEPLLHARTRYTLGQSGLAIGPIAYGCWRFAGSDPASAQAKVETALSAGMTLIDTADIYGLDSPAGFGGAEALLGEVFRSQPSLRYDMVLASKGGIVPGVPYNSTKSYLMRACEASLKRLRTEVIDLYQIHRPDMLAPFEEVADALDTLRSQGKIREAGVSNYSASQFRALQAHLDFPLASHQPEFSALNLTSLFDGVLDQCQETGAFALAWSPLAGGKLIHGQVEDKEKARRLYAVAAILDEIAATNSVSRAAAALAFTMVHPARVIPIVGTQTPARIKETAAATQVKMTRADWYRVVEACMGTRLP